MLMAVTAIGSLLSLIPTYLSVELAPLGGLNTPFTGLTVMNPPPYMLALVPVNTTGASRSYTFSTLYTVVGSYPGCMIKPFSPPSLAIIDVKKPLATFAIVVPIAFAMAVVQLEPFLTLFMMVL